MNILRDTLRDFFREVEERPEERGLDWEEDLLDEYVERIKGELIGKYFED